MRAEAQEGARRGEGDHGETVDTVFSDRSVSPAWLPFMGLCAGILERLGQPWLWIYTAGPPLMFCFCFMGLASWGREVGWWWGPGGGECRLKAFGALQCLALNTGTG